MKNAAKKTSAIKQTAIWKLPEILIIQLKRFENGLRKITRPISISPNNQIDMTEYVFNPKVTSGRGITGTFLKDSLADGPVHRRQIYDLYATVDHSGSLQGGHYTSKCNVFQNQWYLFNDSNVKKISPNNIVTSNTYIMFFKLHESSKSAWN